MSKMYVLRVEPTVDARLVLLADKHKVPIGEVVGMLLSREFLIEENLDRGAKLLLQQADGTCKEIIGWEKA